MLWFFALFPLVTLPWLKYFPVSGENVVQVEKDAVDLAGSAKGLALAAMFVYFLAQGVVWAYLFLIGIAGGLTEQQVANGLTVSQFAGIAGALGAALSAGRYGRAVPLTASASSAAPPRSTSSSAASARRCTWSPSASTTSPGTSRTRTCSAQWRASIVAAASSSTRSRCRCSGSRSGPSLAASVIEEGNYVNVNLLGGALFVASAAFILPPVLAQARRIRALQAA